MEDIKQKLKDLFNRIPRRHSSDNVKQIYSLLEEYETILITMEADEQYAKQVPPLFDVLDPVRATIKKSNDNKASKKTKDQLFDEASGDLKDSIEACIRLIV